MPRPSTEAFVVLVPVLDDWNALRQLIVLLDRQFAASQIVGDLLVVDDGSQSPPPSDLVSAPTLALREVHGLRLRRNLGHQRAIAIGLEHIANHLPCTAVIIMDADGEDKPSDVPRLIEGFRTTGGERAVFAKRARRSESVVFQLGYAIYCGLHRVLTGLRVEVGNFSVLPFAIVRRLGSVGEMWNHYAAAVVKARIPRVLVPADRGMRLAGQTGMNFVALVTHGLSAMSVFADRIGVRMLVASAIMCASAVVGLIAVVGVRFGSALAIPGWATSTAGLLGVLLLQAVMLSFAFAVSIQAGRSSESFLASRDYTYFIDTVELLYPVDE